MSSPRLFALLASTIALPAQTIWNVGAGGFAQLDPAIAAAQPGDVIQVAPGDYQVFTLDKALTIAALPGGPVRIVQDLTSSTFPTVRLRPPIGTTAYLRGIEIHNLPVTIPFGQTRAAVECVLDRGTVCCEDCLFEATAMRTAPGLLVSGARAVLRHCYLVGYNVAYGRSGYFQSAGLQVSNADVEAVDCWFCGSFGAFDLGSPGPAILAQNALIHCVRCLVEGGTELSCITAGPAPGVMSQQSRVWLADCTVRGGNSPCLPGAPAIQHTGLPLEHDRCTFTSGTGTTTPPPIQGPSQQVPLLGLAADSQPLLLGQPWSIAWRAQPSAPVFVLGTTELGSPAVPIAVEPVLLAPNGIALLATLLTDGAGAATFTLTLPATPALRYAHLHVQGFTGSALPLRAAPPLGYTLR